MTWWMILLIVIAVAIILLVVLYKFGDNLQKKQMAQKEQMAEAAQPVTMLIIDKKIMPLKDANLPKIVMEQTPKKYQKAKLPIVKAKIGAQIKNLICDDVIFDELPTRGEVKAMVSGIYIISVKSVRNKKKNAAVEENTNRKKTFREKLRARQVAYQKQLNDQMEAAKYAPKEKTKSELKKERERAKKIKDAIK